MSNIIEVKSKYPILGIQYDGNNLKEIEEFMNRPIKFGLHNEEWSVGTWIFKVPGIGKPDSPYIDQYDIWDWNYSLGELPENSIYEIVND